LPRAGVEQANSAQALLVRFVRDRPAVVREVELVHVGGVRGQDRLLAPRETKKTQPLELGSAVGREIDAFAVLRELPAAVGDLLRAGLRGDETLLSALRVENPVVGLVCRDRLLDE